MFNLLIFILYFITLCNSRYSFGYVVRNSIQTLCRLILHVILRHGLKKPLELSGCVPSAVTYIYYIITFEGIYLHGMSPVTTRLIMFCCYTVNIKDKKNVRYYLFSVWWCMFSGKVLIKSDWDLRVALECVCVCCVYN